MLGAVQTQSTKTVPAPKSYQLKGNLCKSIGFSDGAWMAKEGSGSKCDETRQINSTGDLRSPQTKYSSRASVLPNLPWLHVSPLPGREPPLRGSGELDLHLHPCLERIRLIFMVALPPRTWAETQPNSFHISQYTGKDFQQLNGEKSEDKMLKEKGCISHSQSPGTAFLALPCFKKVDQIS